VVDGEIFPVEAGFFSALFAGENHGFLVGEGGGDEEDSREDRGDGDVAVEKLRFFAECDELRIDAAVDGESGEIKWKFFGDVAENFADGRECDGLASGVQFFGGENRIFAGAEGDEIARAGVGFLGEL